MKNKNLKKSLKKFSKEKEDKLVLLVGILGIPIDGNKTVEVPGRNGFVFVRLRGNTSELIQAYNAVVSNIYGLPVLLARQGNVYKIVGRDLDRYQDWGNAPYLPKHGFQHSFNPSIHLGADVTWIYSQQFMPMLSYPSGTVGGMTLAFHPHFYEWNGQWKFAQDTGTPSFSPYVPTITGSAKMALLYLNGSDNSLRILAGGEFSGSITGSAQIAQHIPTVSRDTGIPLVAVRLPTGTTNIGWSNLYDIRDFYSRSPSAWSGIGIQDEGVPVGTGSVFNFVGAGVVASVSGSVINVNVSSGGGTPGGSNTQIQYNNSGSFGGAKIDYTESAFDIFLTTERNGDNGMELHVHGADSLNNGDAGGIHIDGGDAPGTGGGGSVDFIAGNSDGGTAGNVTFRAGDTSTGVPGHVEFRAGAPSGTVYFVDPSGNKGTLDLSALTADRVYALPNQSGILSVVGHVHTYTNLIGGNGAGQTVAASTTTGLALYASGFIASGANAPVIKGGILKNLSIRIAGTQPASGNFVFTVMINNVASSITVTQAAGAGAATISDTTHTETVSAGDLVYVRAVNNATGASAPVGVFMMELEVTTN